MRSSLRRLPPDDRNPDRSALAGRRPNLSQVFGVILIVLGVCVLPHLVWLFVDSQRLELVEPATPWVILDVGLFLGLASIGGCLLSRSPSKNTDGR